MGFSDLRDLAQVVEVVIENPPKHYRARYELCGENLSYTKYAQLIAKVSGKPVEIRKVNGAEIAKKASRGDTDFEDRMNRMSFYYDQWGLPVGNSNILEWLLGTKARTLEGFVGGEMCSYCVILPSLELVSNNKMIDMKAQANRDDSGR
jgi:nucleoside-diphosphate-sugar epimerase